MKHLESLQTAFKPYHAEDHIYGTHPEPKRVQIYAPAQRQRNVGSYLQSSTADIDLAVKACQASEWPHKFTAEARAAGLEGAANLLEDNTDELLSLCTLEAGKSYLDGVDEIREAVDFCRYYAEQARLKTASNRNPLGIVACISSWNFPLAIFLGQIAASLVMGNTVIAKPAEQTPLIAHKAVSLLYAAGTPKDALHLIMGDGARLGNHLTQHRDVSGVCFTGSTRTAKIIAKTLADTQRAAIPFIAETGGLNAMIVDSTALIEQAVQDVIDSSFQSAGQRCSACRIVCVQDDIADVFTEMLSGAMAQLNVGNPALLKTDVGPVIDAQARDAIADYAAKMSRKYKVIGRSPAYEGAESGYFVSPIAFEVTADFLCRRDGPILPLLSAASDPQRFCHERTVTNNITAAGGNASLLTLS